MQRFSYARTGRALKNQAFSLVLIAGVDLVSWVVAFFIVPPPWNVWLAVGGLVLTALVYWWLTGVLRTSHTLDGQRLRLQMGRHGVAIDRADIRAAAAVTEPLPKGTNPAGVSYRSSTDTLYVLADHRRLVALTLARPYAMLVPERGLCQFTRVVLSLDEPDRFLAALGEPDGERPETGPEQTASGERTAGEGTAVERTAGERTAGERTAGERTAGVLAAPATVEVGPTRQAEEGAEPPALQLKGLVKRFGGFTAVHGVDLAVRPGEVLAFLGSNGAGKSTTIRMATGLLRPTAGQVLVEGRDLWAEGGPARRLVGYVPDVPLLHEALTAREFLWLVAGLYGLPEQEGRRRAEELLKLVKLERWGDHQIRSFSLGMKRKMAIAAALVHRPTVLLLDEVTNGLDPRATREVKDFIAGAARGGAAVLLTTHILEVAEELAHRIAIIHDGQIRAVGSLEELRAQTSGSSLEEIFLSLTDDRGLEVSV